MPGNDVGQPAITRVLLVEDSAVDARLVLGLLGHLTEPCSVTPVTTLQDAFKELDQSDYEIVLLDLGLPDSFGLSTLHRLRAYPCNIPIIVLTGSEDATTGEGAIHEGAQDYIPKGELRAGMLARSIRYARERHRAAMGLQTSERHLRQFIEEAPVCVAMFDRDMRYLAVSRRWVEDYGRGRQDLVGLIHYELHPDIPQRWKEFHRRGLGGDTLRNNEDRWVGEDGSERWLRWAIHPWHGTSGDIGGIIISAEDITQRVQAEARLRFQESLLRETGHLAKVGGWEFDVTTGAGYWTEEVAHIHEVDVQIQPNREFGLNFYRLESRKKLERAIEEAVRNGLPYDLELELTTAKGNQRWVRTIAHPIFDGDKVAKLRGSIQDVTERKIVEDTLRRQASLIDQVYDAVFVWEIGGTITFWNCGAEKVYGFSRAQAIGRRSHELLATTPAAVDHFLGCLTQVGGWEGELEHTRADGKRIVVESRMVQITEGERSYVLETNRDVSERKLLEDQLRQSQKMEAIGRLAGGVAHDFNNLLGVILGSAELAAESTDLMKVRKSLDQIRKAGERAANLTKQLLAFSRKQVLEPRVLDLNAKVADITEMLRRLVGEDIDVNTSLASDLWSVRVDPSQIEQILLNLAVNSRDAMPEGGRLTIETRNVQFDEAYTRSHASASPGQYVMVAVSDSGCGMDAETQARIFEPFFTTKKHGTGLGLATVYGAVKQSGGAIWVYSEPGKGTTFKIYFPRVMAVDSGGGSDAHGSSRSSGTETILLVEDSESLRTVTREFLLLAGYTVKEAGNGEEALNIALTREGPIHLLLTDVVMPGMGGRELAKAVAQLHPEMRVLFISGYTANAIVSHGDLEEGTSFLSKPFSRATLTSKVRELLNSLPNSVHKRSQV